MTEREGERVRKRKRERERQLDVCRRWRSHGGVVKARKRDRLSAEFPWSSIMQWKQFARVRLPERTKTRVRAWLRDVSILLWQPLLQPSFSYARWKPWLKTIARRSSVFFIFTYLFCFFIITREGEKIYCNLSQVKFLGNRYRLRDSRKINSIYLWFFLCGVISFLYLDGIFPRWRRKKRKKEGE